MTTSGHASAHSRFRPSVPALVFALLAVPVGMSAAITLTFSSVAGGVSLTGSGTGTAGLSFGTVSRYGPFGAGMTRTVGASNYTLATTMGVSVTKSGGPPSPSYTLQARLGASSVYTWRVQGVTLTTTYANLAVSEAYSTIVSRSLEFVIPNSQTTGLSVSQAIEFLAIAN